MKKLILLFLLLPFMGWAQDKGTHFEHGLSWQQVKEKAKKENKFLLVDCFATWCGPCKYMTNTIFPQEKVGNFFNKNFVNVKVQFDKTKDDSEEVKKWYADAQAIEKEFNIPAYPTFLIFSPNGELVHRIVGGSKADEFIAKAQKALNAETQYYTLLKKSAAGSSSPEDLKKLIIAAEEASDRENSKKIAAAYIDSQKDLFTKENLLFLGKYMKDSKSKGFELVLKNPEKVDAILGKGKSTEMLTSVILQENIYPGLSKPTSNIDSLIAAANAKYPTVDMTKFTDLLKVQFYQRNQNWEKFQPAVMNFIKKYETEVTPEWLNEYAWTVFENCKDVDCINAALGWSKRSVEQTQEKEPMFLDTYANLLYKLGKKEEAITMQQKAVDLVPGEDKAQYQTTLDRMKKGE